MKKALLLALLVLAACSRNPDPEYAPETDDAADVVAAPAAEAAPAPEPAPAPAPAATLSEDETYRLGREAAALLFANDMAALWPRFDTNVQAQAQSPENFGAMVTQIFGQIGAEGSLVEEEVVVSPDQPGLSIYRRRGHYLTIGQDANLLVAFNADGTIAGINIQPAQ